jgi:hypothetical protein
MTLNSPVPFLEALRALQQKKLLPTALNSAEIRKLAAALRNQSFFSSETLLTEYLDGLKKDVLDIINPRTEFRADRITPENPQGKVTVGMNPSTARLRAKELLGELDYQPDEELRGTIKDLSSDRRIDLMLKTNTDLVHGAGNFVQGQNADVLDAFPAQELFRAESRTVERGSKRGPKSEIVDDPGNSWESRWRAAATISGDTDALRVFTQTGRMVARKDSPIWQALGDGAGGYTDTLGNPFPPFAFNSGMWVRDIDRDEAIDLGLMDEKDKVTPLDIDLGDLLGMKEAA